MTGSILRRAWPALALAATLLLIVAFVVRACCFRNDVGFLASRAPAQWIVYPWPAYDGTRPGMPLRAVFRRSFSLASVPAETKLDVRAFRSGTVSLNGKVVPLALDPDHWKTVSRGDVARFLRPGANDLTVTITNTSGPPALWLALSGAETVLASDKSWEVSLAGATWQPAALATAPVPLANIDPDGQAEQVTASLAKVWPAWLLFAGISAAGVWLCGRWLAGGETWGPGTDGQASGSSPLAAARGKKGQHGPRRTAKPDPRRATPPQGKEGNFGDPRHWWNVLLSPPGPYGRWVGLTRLLFLVIAVFWTVLLLHNSPYLGSSFGFDAEAHLAYIDHFRTSWSIPLPGEAWGAQHPPLYYLLTGTLLRLVGYAAATAGGILTIRLFNLLLALANIYLILASLRLMFPEHPRRWVLGLIVAGLLPMFVYLYHYPMNHCLAGTLASATLYFVLRILCASKGSLWDYALAGLALGAAILSIISTSVLVLPVGAVLLAKACLDRADVGWRWALLRVVVLGAVVFLVCGWHYIYVWVNLGTPIVGNMGFGVGSPWAWWQDPGFQTSGAYLRFGESLRSPFFSTWYSVADGLYSTLWGDSYCGGRLVLEDRPPWSYDYVVAGMGLSLAPMAAVVLGAAAATAGFLRKPAIRWAFVLGMALSIAWFVTYYPLFLPYYSCVKASYGIAGIAPLCLLAALGFDLLAASSRWLCGLVFVIVGVWALNSAASYVISPAAAETQRSMAQQLVREKHANEAVVKLEQQLAVHPDDDFARLLLAKVYVNGRLDDAARRVLDVPAGTCERTSRHFLLGLVLARHKQLREARRELRAALRLAPDDVNATSVYAQVVALGPDPRAAIEAWRNALRVNPADTSAHAALTKLYRKVGEPARASEHEEYLRALKEWIRQRKARRS